MRVKLQRLLCVVPALLHCGTVAVAADLAPALKLQISYAGDEASLRTPDAPVLLHYAIVNDSDLDATIVIKESGYRHETYDYPANLCARVRGSDGMSLTSNGPSDCWSSFSLSSSAFVPTPEDRVTLRAHERIDRTVDLLEVLVGCPTLPDGLPAGQYTVTLMLDGLTSNGLTLSIGRRRARRPIEVEQPAGG